MTGEIRRIDDGKTPNDKPTPPKPLAAGRNLSDTSTSSHPNSGHTTREVFNYAAGLSVTAEGRNRLGEVKRRNQTSPNLSFQDGSRADISADSSITAVENFEKNSDDSSITAVENFEKNSDNSSTTTVENFEKNSDNSSATAVEVPKSSDRLSLKIENIEDWKTDEFLQVLDHYRGQVRREHFKEGEYPPELKFTKNRYIKIEVPKTEVPKISRDDVLKNYVAAGEYLNDKLQGKSIRHLLSNGSMNEKDMNALIHVTIGHLIKEKKGVIKMSDEKEIFHLSNTLRRIYGDQKKYRNDAEAVSVLIPYIERQLRKGRKNNFSGLCTQAYSLALDLRPYRNRHLKRAIVENLGLLPQRKKLLEEKYKPSKKKPLKHVSEETYEGKILHFSNKENGDNNISSTEETEMINLGGKRGKEQRLYRLLIDKSKKVLEAHAAIEQANAENKYALDRLRFEVEELIGKHRQERNLTKAREASDAWLRFESRITVDTVQKIDSKMDSHLLTLTQKLDQAENNLKNVMKQYGNKRLQTILNNVASDGGAVVGVASFVFSISVYAVSIAAGSGGG